MTEKRAPALPLLSEGRLKKISWELKYKGPFENQRLKENNILKCKWQFGSRSLKDI